MEKSSYTTEELVCDESFRAYCNGSDPAAIAFWTAWVQARPEMEATVGEAKQLISILNAGQGNVKEQLQQLKDGITRFDRLKASIGAPVTETATSIGAPPAVSPSKSNYRW
ncbi:MAG TPA: hypothetical protein VGE93_11020, partial [Bryobacteraceae bacterium]